MFPEKTKRHQRGTWEVRNLGEDDWFRGDNQSDLKEGNKGYPHPRAFKGFTKESFELGYVFAISRKREFYL